MAADEDESRSTHPDADAPDVDDPGPELPDEEAVENVMGTLPDTITIPADAPTALQYVLMCQQYGRETVNQNLSVNMQDLLDDLHVQLRQLEEQQAQQAAQLSAARGEQPSGPPTDEE